MEEHPITNGIKESFTFAFCSTLPVINCIPNTDPTITAITVPSMSSTLYIISDKFFILSPAIISDDDPLVINPSAP